VQVRDRTADIELARVAIRATNPWTRFRGLMLRGHLEEGSGLIIEPCGSIHMMFMRFSIDAVFYDRGMRVTKVVRGLRPWMGLAFGGRGARGVVELPAGASSATRPGNILEFVA